MRRPDDGELAVRTAAAAAPDLEVLAAAARTCTTCPEPVESARCRGWAERQLELVAPRVVVALGLSATRWFLGPTPLGPVRRRVHDVGGLAVLPTYHPSAAIRFGPQGEPRRLLRDDLALALRVATA